MSNELESQSAQYLARIQNGDGDAAEQVFCRYAVRLTQLARSKLSGRLAVRLDPEDVVMSAWRSFFVGASAGRFAWQRSGDLWRLLVAITLHKLYRSSRRHHAGKRDSRREQISDADKVDWAWQVADDREPSPQEAIELSDELEATLAKLPPVARFIVELRLQGESLEQIAVRAQRSERTIRRVLADVRVELMKRLCEVGE
jgi:RNA polymerase sigma factor (sigma-70 family)